MCVRECFRRLLLRMQIGEMSVPFDGIGRVTFFKNVKFFRKFYIFWYCHFKWLVRNMLAIRCPFNRFPSEVRPFLPASISLLPHTQHTREMNGENAMQLKCITLNLKHSFHLRVPRSANTTCNHETNGSSVELIRVLVL